MQSESPASKLRGRQVDFFVFSGTGNSLLAAEAVAEVLKQEGLSVRLHRMDKAPSPNLEADAVLGLAFPVACFSTYPTVWRFIDSLPPGEGRQVFMLGTCGGLPAGTQGPVRKTLLKKGYRPLAAQIFLMPGNYNNKTLPVDKNAKQVEKALLDARSFAHDLLKGAGDWSGGTPLLSSFFYHLAHTLWPWRSFYRFFPLSVDADKCVHCKRCVEECPASAITMADHPVVDPRLCESCQRCVGFCPTEAFHVPNKPAKPYRAMPYEKFKGAFDSSPRGI